MAPRATKLTLTQTSSGIPSPERNLIAAVIHRWLVDATDLGAACFGVDPERFRRECLESLLSRQADFAYLCSIIDLQDPDRIIDMVMNGVIFTSKPGPG